MGDTVQEANGRADLRRAELVETTLRTLATVGYARTSVREIAQQSPFSHGVLHYYFKDKDELILAAVRLYKQRCSRRYESLLEDAVTADQLADGLATQLVDHLTHDALEHRLWYDLRAQAMFQPELQAEVLEIDELLAEIAWRLALRYAQLRDSRVAAPRTVVYAALDGVVQKALLDHLAGIPDALARLRTVAPATLDLFVSRG